MYKTYYLIYDIFFLLWFSVYINTSYQVHFFEGVRQILDLQKKIKSTDYVVISSFQNIRLFNSIKTTDTTFCLGFNLETNVIYTGMSRNFDLSLSCLLSVLLLWSTGRVYCGCRCCMPGTSFFPDVSARPARYLLQWGL